MRARGHGIAVGLALLSGAALAGCDALPGKPRPGAHDVAPSQVVAFDVLYAQHCAGCHGVDGRLGAARPLNDPVFLALVPRERLRQVIARGVPGTAQPPLGQSAGGELTDAQIEALVQGMIGAWARPDAARDAALPPYDAETARAKGSGPGDPERGKAVFAAVCAGCHGPDGRGGPKAGSIVDPSFLNLVSDQGLRTTVIAGRPDLGMPDWRGSGAGPPLQPQQISDVVAWLAAERKPVPGRLAEADSRRSTP